MSRKNLQHLKLNYDTQDTSSTEVKMQSTAEKIEVKSHYTKGDLELSLIHI